MTTTQARTPAEIEAERLGNIYALLRRCKHETRLVEIYAGKERGVIEARVMWCRAGKVRVYRWLGTKFATRPDTYPVAAIRAVKGVVEEGETPRRIDRPTQMQL